MATMSFTVPDEVQDRFEEAFQSHDRSAVVTGLLVLAVQAEERRRRRSLSLTERLRQVGERHARPADDRIGRPARWD
jgi:hypothetical protein